MSILLQLSSLALKGAAEAAEAVRATSDAVGPVPAGAIAGGVVGFLARRFTDHSQRLTRALNRSTDHAWRAVELAMAGRSWWDKCKLALTSAQERAFRAQVQAFLDAHPLNGVNGFGPDFRAQCLAQLQAVRKVGLLEKNPPTPEQLAQQVGNLSRFGDPTAVVAAEYRSVVSIAGQLREHGYEALATFLELRPASGPPVLVSAVRYFFQREVESDRELFQGLAYARLEDLAKGQSAGFSALAEALDEHGERLSSLLADVHAVVVQTREDVLDIKAEMQRQGQQMQELGAAVLRALQQHQLEQRELHGGDSLSVRDEDERRQVRILLNRYRSLPAEQRRQLPALLNAVGKLEVVTGEFESAEKDFRALAEMVPESSARAEAAHNAYLAALERRAWDDALKSLKEAARLDPARFAPFPTDKFDAEKILGAGGFGVAFLCRNTRSSGRVVIKTLRRDGLERDLVEVFREAQMLEELDCPAIIRIRDCDYADAARSRPYLVMDFFQGQTLAEYVEKNGPLSVAHLLPLARLTAEGLQRAHERGILHRDVKPANLLVRRTLNNPSPPAPLPGTERGGPEPLTPPLRFGEGAGGRGSSPGEGGEGIRWDAKLIDFGLAMRADTPNSTMRASLDRTLLGASIAGTIEYAAPEQMGKLKGVAVGPYSDVYGFGKTCCFALFGTPQPTFQHWQQLPRELADLLGRCLNEQHRARPQDFTSVLRELDRLLAPRPRAVPAVPVARVMEAQSVPMSALEEVIPIEPIQPRSRPRPERESLPEPMRPRSRPPREEEEAPPPVKKRGTSAVVLVLLAVVFGIIGFIGFVMYMPLPRGTSTPGGWTSPTQPTSSTTDWMGPKIEPVAPATPIKLEEFKKVLDELEDKPAVAKLRELAGRLIVTAPTDGQIQKHENVKELRNLPGGPNKVTLAQEEANDEILQVSRALNPLLREKQPADKKLAAQAMQKWGTEDNVDDLIANVDTGEFGVYDTRIEIAKALAIIGDKRAIPPLMKRFREDHYDRGRGLTGVMVLFGSKVELEMLGCLAQGKGDIALQKSALQVLKEVGTLQSIQSVELMKKNPALKGDAEVACTAIWKRVKQK